MVREMTALTVAMLAVGLAVGLFGCDGDGGARGGPTCCNCYSVDYTTGCIKTGTLEDRRGLGECETACKAADYKGCGNDHYEDCSPGADAGPDPYQLARTAFETLCKEDRAPICGWTYSGGDEISKAGTCLSGGIPWTCVVNGTIHLFERGCTSSASLGSDGSFQASCSYQPSATEVESFSYEGTLVGEILTTRRVFEHNTVANGRVVEPCNLTMDISYTRPSCN
jgi:hypothetical protein